MAIALIIQYLLLNICIIIGFNIDSIQKIVKQTGGSEKLILMLRQFKLCIAKGNYCIIKTETQTSLN